MRERCSFKILYFVGRTDGETQIQNLKWHNFLFNGRQSINIALLAYSARFEDSWGDWLIGLPRTFLALASKAHVLESPFCPRQTPGHLVTAGLFSVLQGGRVNRMGNEDSCRIELIGFPCHWRPLVTRKEISMCWHLKLIQAKLILSSIFILPPLSPHTRFCCCCFI